MGMTSSFWVTSTMTILQTRVPEGLRSRVVTVQFMIITGVNINWWITGLLADLVGDRQALFLMGIIPTGVLLVMLLTIKQVVFLGTQRYPLVIQPVPDQPATAAFLGPGGELAATNPREPRR